MMKPMILFVLLIMLSCQNSRVKSYEKQNNVEGDANKIWDLEKEKQHNKYRNDSTKMSQINWKADTKNIIIKGEPMTMGVYPVPKYELSDSTFNGLGYSGNWDGVDFKNKKIIYHSLYVNRNNINKDYIGNKENEVFFIIAVLTDEIDLNKYTHTNVDISSRNHPHYTGQGFVKTKNNKIDFVSFITADRNAYAIVNMRLFDLRIGRLVLIAPQTDGTIRSLQIEEPIMTSDEADKKIKYLIKNDKNIIEFFSRKGTI